jgi:NADPH:quinone reductase-like Zn-dependent oxidoreductase
MKAAIYSKTNSGKVLEISDAQKPSPKDKEVLIKVRAASVNPLDWRMKSTHPGVDLAGEVEAVGRAVTRFKPGDAVFGMGRGAFAEYACAPESRLVLKPENITFEQAASIPVAGLTALQGLRDKGRLKSGQRVLINGAAGGIGTFAVQIAKSLGADVTAVCSPRNVELARSLGADRVIDYTQRDFTDSKERYDVLLDNVGNRTLSALRRILAPRGRCVLAGAPKTLSGMLARIIKAFAWSPFLRQKFIFFIANPRPVDLQALCDLIQTEKLVPAIDKVYPLSEAADAIAYVETGHARAKVVIRADSHAYSPFSQFVQREVS